MADLKYTDRGFGSNDGVFSARGVLAFPYEQPDLALGNSILRLSAVIDAAAERQDRIDASFFKTEVQAKFSNEVYGDGTDANPGLVNTRKGTSAVGISASVDLLSEWVGNNDKYKNMPNILRADFDDWYLQYSTNERIKLANYEQKELIRGQLEQNAVVMDGIAQQAAILPLNDDPGYGIIKSQLDEAMASRAAIEGWTPEYTAMQSRNAFSAMLTNSAYMSPSAVEALRFLKAKGAWVTNTDMQEATSRLQPKIEAEMARQQAAAVKAAKARAKAEGSEMTDRDAYNLLLQFDSYDDILDTLGEDAAKDIVKMASDYTKNDDKITNIQHKNTLDALKTDMTLAQRQYGRAAADQLRAEAFAKGLIDVEENADLNTFSTDLDSADKSVLANLSPEFRIARENFLADAERGLINGQALDAALSSHLITGDEYQELGQSLRDGTRTPLSTAAGKQVVKALDTDVFGPRIKAAGDDYSLLENIAAQRTEVLNALNEEVRAGTRDLNNIPKILEYANSTVDVSSDRVVFPDFISEDAGTALLQKIVTTPGIPVESFRYFARNIIALHNTKFGGRSMSEEEFLIDAQKLSLDQNLDWSFGSEAAAKAARTTKNRRRGGQINR